MSIVGGGIIGATVSILQARFGMVRDVGTASFIAIGAFAGFAGSMVGQGFLHPVSLASVYSISFVCVSVARFTFRRHFTANTIRH